MSTREVVLRGARAARLSPHAPRRLTVLLLAAAAVTAVGGMAAAALTTAPPRSLVEAGPERERGSVEGPATVGLGRSAPVRIVIPRLAVDAAVVPLRVDRAGLGVPADPRHAGWYERGTSPGELGSAVIVGRSGPPDAGRPVFAELDRLAAGDTIHIGRADGTVASFAVDLVERAGPVGWAGHADHADTGREVQLRLVATDRTDPPVDHQVVVFATLRS
jgi:hypothetical protein